MMLAALYDTQKNQAMAETHYRQALNVKADFAPAANNLAYILAEREENLDEALNFARIAKEKLPQDPAVMDTIGWVYYKKGLYDSAIAEFSESAEKLPHNPMIHYHLGLALHKKQEDQKARNAFEKALALDPQFEKTKEIKEILKTF